MASWQENALLITAGVGAIGTAQLLVTAPKVLKGATPAEMTNVGLSVISGVVGTALGFDYWRRTREERLNMAKLASVPPSGTASSRRAVLGHQ